MRKKEEKIDGVTALRDYLLQTIVARQNGTIDDDAVRLTNASAAKAIQSAVAQNAYHKRMGYDRKIPFLEK